MLYQQEKGMEISYTPFSSCYHSMPKSIHIELSHSFEHFFLSFKNLLFHRPPLPHHLQGVALAGGHEVDPGVNGLQVDDHLDVPDGDDLLAGVQLLKHLHCLLSCDSPETI